MGEILPIRRYSKPYDVFMTNVDHLRTVYKFYPWAAHEMHSMLPQIPTFVNEFMPGITVEEALYRIDRSTLIVLCFSVVHLVSIFEDYVNNAVRELMTKIIDAKELLELNKADTQQSVEEYTAHRQQRIEDEVHRLSFKPWREKQQWLYEKYEIELSEDLKTSMRKVYDTRNKLVHNPAMIDEEEFDINPKFVEWCIDSVVQVAALIEDVIPKKGS